ncbi:aldo/keto reductase [Siphonobacter sp. SORGH_AS_1065]|uniref:aldo/keto reductase n=1 Tax=Siphonobacter sp. SORGH_AS_1065 TaxID=3041795 RepID=UPI002780679B|nr:aldo/keto reductase [Siphonobacter sp. SORGH_AS_1065]MDQ1088773.1 D-threo-aldose 1-dehydrogenase [Siphonobacter sp. SORGH_AS_1065]
MITRRHFLTNTLKGVALTGTAPLLTPFWSEPSKESEIMTEDQKIARKHYRLPYHSGLGGVAIGNGFKPTSDEDAEQALEAAWAQGVRYFDTSPWYGLGLSERRFGHFLKNQKREDYVLSTKVGRILKATKTPPKALWQNPSPFQHTYDYTASGVRRSVEDSLQRLGLDSIDIVFIHDLSPDNGDLKERWTEQFEIAAKGAMPELTKMREEGIIKGWGLGVNTIEPILKTLEVADPDVCLSATQYSLMYHQDALDRLFPACEKKDVSIVVGAPLNAGFLAGVDRYNYSGQMPEGYKQKREKISAIAKKHGTDLRTVALHFSAAPSVVSAVIPGARTAQQASENAISMKTKVPAEVWQELKAQKLISEQAPTPKLG